MSNQSSKFRGGVWIGYLQATWPFGVLEVDDERLAIYEEITRKRLDFTHDQIEKIEVKKYFPVVGYAIRVYPKNKTLANGQLYFWYASFYFQDLLDTLRRCHWLD